MDIKKILLNQFSKAVGKQIIEKIHIAEKKLQPFIIPIYCEWSENFLTLLGSGILIKINSNHILITAAHVIDDSDKGNLSIPFENTLIGLDGFYCSPIPKGKTRDDDMFDFAFAFLDESTISGLLQNYEFLDYKNILLKDMDTLVKIYSCIGFPGSKNKTINSIKPAPYSYFNTSLDESKMTEHNIDSNINLAISYNSKSTYSSDGQKQQVPKPKGISGGGIFTWKIEDKNRIGNYKVTPFLAGVFIATSNHNKIWIGTKIQPILQGIRNSYTNLKKLIPDYQNYNLDLILKKKW